MLGLFSNKENEITDAISECYTMNEGKDIRTNIEFKYAEKFINKHGGTVRRYDDGGVGGDLDMDIHDDTLSITFARSRMTGKTNITVFGSVLWKEYKKNILNNILD